MKFGKAAYTQRFCETAFPINFMQGHYFKKIFSFFFLKIVVTQPDEIFEFNFKAFFIPSKEMWEFFRQ